MNNSNCTKKDHEYEEVSRELRCDTALSSKIMPVKSNSRTIYIKSKCKNCGDLSLLVIPLGNNNSYLSPITIVPEDV